MIRYLLVMYADLSLCRLRTHVEAGVLARIYSPSLEEADTGGSLKLRGQSAQPKL